MRCLSVISLSYGRYVEMDVRGWYFLFLISLLIRGVRVSFDVSF